MKRNGWIYPDCHKCGEWLSFKLAKPKPKRITVTCTCGWVFGGTLHNMVGGVRWIDRFFVKLLALKARRKELAAKARAPILAVENPGEKELLALNKIISQLLEYCAESDVTAFEVSHYIKNQDIEIERLRKKLKKAKAVHN